MRSDCIERQNSPVLPAPHGGSQGATGKETSPGAWLAAITPRFRSRFSTYGDAERSLIGTPAARAALLITANLLAGCTLQPDYRRPELDVPCYRATTPVPNVGRQLSSLIGLIMLIGIVAIALGIGFDASFRQPLAIAGIGGLVTSTLLSLLVVPVISEVVDDSERRIRKLPRPVFLQSAQKEYATT